MFTRHCGVCAGSGPGREGHPQILAQQHHKPAAALEANHAFLNLAAVLGYEAALRAGFGQVESVALAAESAAAEHRRELAGARRDAAQAATVHKSAAASLHSTLDWHKAEVRGSETRGLRWRLCSVQEPPTWPCARVPEGFTCIPPSPTSGVPH